MVVKRERSRNNGKNSLDGLSGKTYWIDKRMLGKWFSRRGPLKTVAINTCSGVLFIMKRTSMSAFTCAILYQESLMSWRCVRSCKWHKWFRVPGEICWHTLNVPAILILCRVHVYLHFWYACCFQIILEEFRNKTIFWIFNHRTSQEFPTILQCG